MNQTVISRFAPSPTGHLHLGSARTALFAYLFAKRHGGRFLLRIEDTDPARSKPEFTQSLLEALDWLGLNSDEPPLYQSQRLDRYRTQAKALVQSGHAYVCTCSSERLETLRQAQLDKGINPQYDRKCRDLGLPIDTPDSVIRLKAPWEEGAIHFTDLIRGPITTSHDALGDFILIRSGGLPTYHLAVTMDDIATGVTHIIRGEDHIANTPKQLLLYRALGQNPPQFAHLSMIHGQDGAKLSKRHGALNLLQYKEEGYLPEGLLNFLLRLGFSHGDQELFTPQEMTEHFSLERLSKSRAIFDPDKLLWVNQQKLLNLSSQAILEQIKKLPFYQKAPLEADSKTLCALIEIFQPSCPTLQSHLDKLTATLQRPKLDPSSDVVQTHLDIQSLERLQILSKELQNVPFEGPVITDFLKAEAKALGVKFAALGKPLRVALLGVDTSPDISQIMAALGQQEVLARLQACFTSLQ